MYKLYTQTELMPYVGKTLHFQVWGLDKSGVLEFDGRFLWLPFCGGVKATSVLIKLL